MRQKIESLNATAMLLQRSNSSFYLNYTEHFFVSQKIRELENQLRELYMIHDIPGDMIVQLEKALDQTEKSVDQSVAHDFDKYRIKGLIQKLRKRLQINIINPKGCNISAYTRSKLMSLKQFGFVGDIVITSTERSVEDQARIMYENTRRDKQEQLNTYKAPGQRVVMVYDPNLSREANIANMAAQIRKEGPANVSKHIADSTKLNVIDVDKNALRGNVRVFKDSLNKAGFTKVLDEDKNGCIHIELPQP